MHTTNQEVQMTSIEWAKSAGDRHETEKYPNWQIAVLEVPAQLCSMIQLAEIYNMTRQKTCLYLQCQTVVYHNVCNRTESSAQFETAFSWSRHRVVQQNWQTLCLCYWLRAMAVWAVLYSRCPDLLTFVFVWYTAWKVRQWMRWGLVLKLDNQLQWDKISQKTTSLLILWLSCDVTAESSGR